MLDKIMSDETIDEDLRTILTLDLAEFTDVFVECAINDPDKSAILAQFTKTLGVFQANQTKVEKHKLFKFCVITKIQQKFETLLTAIDKDFEQCGICKFIGELFNLGILTSNIIRGCLERLRENSSEASEESSEVLLDTITRKVINNQDEKLLENVTNFILEKSMSEK